MEVTLPVPGHPAGGSWHRLVERVMKRSSGGWAIDVLPGGVVPEPVLTWLEGLGDRMIGLAGVAAPVL